jgi:hypothetical protein
MPAPATFAKHEITLEQLERQEQDVIQSRLAKPKPKPDVWEAIEPMPSNPSRIFPEFKHPQLS